MEVTGASFFAVERSERYKELLNTVTAISQEELTPNLRELAEAGLLAREAGDTRTSRYSLTGLGKGLMPMFRMGPRADEEQSWSRTSWFVAKRTGLG
jgi:DNA-binding HxlR family transcriptional regulator